MSAILLHQYIYAKDTDQKILDSIKDQIIDLFSRIFINFDRDYFIRIFPKFNFIHLMNDREGNLSGANLIRYETIQLDKPDGKVSVLNHFAGIMPQYRGGNSVMRFIIAETIKQKLRNPLRKIYYFTRFVHPSPYKLLVKYGAKPYPSPMTPYSKKYSELIRTLSEKLDYRVYKNAYNNYITPPSLFVKDEMKGAEKYTKDCLITQFFHEQCPEYKNGQGLMVINPVDILGIFTGISRFIVYRMKKIAASAKKIN